ETGVEALDIVPVEATVIPPADSQFSVVDQPIDSATVPSTSESTSSEASTVVTVEATTVDTTVPPTEASVEGEPIDGVPTPTVVEVRQERRQLRVLSGMAAMLAMMRDGGGEEDKTEEEAAPAVVPPSVVVAAPAAPVEAAAAAEQVPAAVAAAVEKKAEPVGEGGRKLNRQERRAMMRAQGMFEENAKKAEEQREEENKIEPAPTVGKRRRVCMETVNVSASAFFTESRVFSDLPTPSGYQPVVYGNNYVRSVQFSSGGRNLATTSQDRHLRLFKFDEEKCETFLTVSLPLGGLIYDAAWHPREEWVATSSRDHPIHLWNEEGERVVSFRGINHLDELSSANTLRFAVDGSRLYAGYHKYLRIFDLNRPGRQTREIKTWSRESGGQRALLSCIGVHPLYEGVIAVGCYGRSIGLYSDKSKSVECLFEIGHSALTQLEYSIDGLRLYAATRNDSAIVCYDLRNPGRSLFSLDRPGHTNQSFAFDLDGSDRFLFSGSSTGEVLVFDVKTGESQPKQRVKATESALVGVSVHPSRALLATCCGERIYRVMELSEDEEEGEERKKARMEEGGEGERRHTEEYKEGKQPLDNGFHIWKI
ncbi:hypothetical protein PMAYCL1PPCAC_01765, partial [Pristionchus mayeri]